MEQVFRQVGKIINSYCPESYAFELYNPKDIVAVKDIFIHNVDIIKSYINLEVIFLDYITFNLLDLPLSNLQVLSIKRYRYTDSIDTIKNCTNLYNLYLGDLRQDIIAIQTLNNIRCLGLSEYTFSLSSLIFFPKLRNLILSKYSGSLYPITKLNLEHLIIIKCNTDIALLIGLKINRLTIHCYYGDLTPLLHCKINVLELHNCNIEIIGHIHPNISQINIYENNELVQTSNYVK